MNQLKFLFIFFIAAFLTSCGSGEQYSIAIQPDTNDTYSYEVKGVSTRSFSGEENIMEQLYSFTLNFLDTSGENFPAQVTFQEFDMESPESAMYEEMFQSVFAQLKQDTAQFTMMKNGTITYQIPINDSEEDPVLDFENPEVYMAEMSKNIIENILSNVFSEWVAYTTPDSVTSKSKWTTMSDLSLMGMNEVERKIEWQIAEVDDQFIHIKGTNKLNDFSFPVDMGMEEKMTLHFKGFIESVYDYQLDRNTRMIQTGNILITTDGSISSEGNEDGEMEPISEILKGEAKTTIRRI